MNIKILLPKDIKYTRHARNRMRWRKISDKEIEQVLCSSDEIKEISDNKYSCFKVINNRKVKIVFTIKKDQVIIITAFDKSD